METIIILNQTHAVEFDQNKNHATTNTLIIVHTQNQSTIDTKYLLIKVRRSRIKEIVTNLNLTED